MSRRHHGRPHHHAVGGADNQRRVAGVSPGPLDRPVSKPGNEGAVSDMRPAPIPEEPFAASGPQPTNYPEPEPTRESPVLLPPHEGPFAEPPPAPLVAEPGTAPPMAPARAPGPPMHGAPTNGAPTNGGPGLNGAPGLNGQCTAPQLRRFIKSRPYVPMHELRRRFAIDGGDDDVTPVRLEPGWVYVGLPTREGGLLGELLKAGEIGYELSLDPRTPIVIGIYPMRPIPRS
jgi:hypothetical protein